MHLSHRSIASYARVLAVSAAAVAGVLALAPAPAEASFANSLKKKYTSKISRNPSISAQQVTADPDVTLEGRTSLNYDPSLVTLFYPPDPTAPDTFRYIFSSTFTLTSIEALVSGPGSDPARFESHTWFQTAPAGTVELGVVRVAYQRNNTTSDAIIPPTVGFGDEVNSANYEQGDDLFSVVFYERPEVLGALTAPFTVYTAPGDTITILPEGTTTPVVLGSDDIETVTHALPEPGAAAALIALSGILIRRRR